jgi:carbamate kinase
MAIRLLSERGVTVICAGGGGVPVVVDADGACFGVEAVVDKDLTAALLARELDADRLLLLTDVDAVEQGWGTPAARRIRTGGVAAMRAEPFAAGTMGPKVEAACRFVEATGRQAAIGNLEHCADLVLGAAGTTVLPGAAPLDFW